MPYPGALLDQPAGLIRRMTIAEDAYDVMREYLTLPAGQGASWADRNPEAWELVIELEAEEWQTSGLDT